MLKVYNSFRWVCLSILIVLLTGLSSMMAQTVTITVQHWSGGLYSGSGSDCGDCNGAPDPYVYSRYKYGSTGTWSGTQGNEVDEVNCDNYAGRTTGGDYVVSNVPYTDVIQIQIDGYESDGFVCGSTDGSCGGFGTPNSGSNNVIITSGAGICNYSSLYSSNRENCNSDGSTNDYRVFWRYRWVYDAASLNSINSGGSLSFSVASDANVCEGADPSIIIGSGSVLGS